MTFGRESRLYCEEMTRLARIVLAHRKIVVGAWLVLTLFGAFAAGQVSKRWFQSFSIPGY